MKRWSAMAKAFTRIGKDIVMAVKEGGPNPDANSRLRAVIQNAKAANMPKENVERAIKKATDKDTANYKEVLFEGYAPHGIALLIETATDNNNRTVANIRSYFNKCNGTMGTQGSVEFMFDHTCNFRIPKEGLDPEELELEFIDFGAEEVFEDEDGILIYAPFGSFGTIQKELENRGLEILSSGFERIPQITKKLTEDQVADEDGGCGEPRPVLEQRGQLQGVQDALPCAHRDALAAAMQLNVKSLVIGMGAGVRTEALEMDGVVRPVACHVLHRVHQALGAAAIHMGAVGHLFEDLPEIERARRIAVVMVDDHLPGQLRCTQIVKKRGAFGIAGEVVKLERAQPLGLQLAHHGHHWRDADASAHEDEAAGLFAQGEQVLRCPNHQQVALSHLVNQADGAAASGRVALDRELIETVLLRVVTEGVLAHRATGHAHGKMGAGCEGGQGATFGVAQLEHVDVASDLAPGVHAQNKVVWKASDVHPMGYPTVEAIVRMGKKLETATNGRISIQM